MTTKKTTKIDALALYFSKCSYLKPSDYAITVAEACDEKAAACLEIKVVGRPVSEQSLRRGRQWLARARAFRRAAEMLVGSQFDVAEPAFDIGG